MKTLETLAAWVLRSIIKAFHKAFRVHAWTSWTPWVTYFGYVWRSQRSCKSCPVYQERVFFW